MGWFDKLFKPEKYKVYVVDRNGRKVRVEVDDKLDAWAFLGALAGQGEGVKV